MGTFTKSFSGMGGYISASQEIIDYLRVSSAGMLYHNSLSPIVSQQIITTLNILMYSKLGELKIKKLKENSNYFRNEMIKLGLHVYGDYDTPIIPVLIYLPTKVAAFSRECLKRGVAVVVVGYPATTIILSRVRFCISANHTIDDLKFAIKVIDEVAQLTCIKYKKSIFGL